MHFRDRGIFSCCFFYLRLLFNGSAQSRRFSELKIPMPFIGSSGRTQCAYYLNSEHLLATKEERFRYGEVHAS